MQDLLFTSTVTVSSCCLMPRRALSWSKGTSHSLLMWRISFCGFSAFLVCYAQNWFQWWQRMCKTETVAKEVLVTGQWWRRVVCEGLWTCLTGVPRIFGCLFIPKRRQAICITGPHTYPWQNVAVPLLSGGWYEQLVSETNHKSPSCPFRNVPVPTTFGATIFCFPWHDVFFCLSWRQQNCTGNHY